MNGYNEQLATQCAKQRDDLIEMAISSRLGTGWAIQQIPGRLVFKIFPSGDEILYLDNEPVLELKPLRFEYTAKDGSFVITVTQPYRLISATPEDVGQR